MHHHCHLPQSSEVEFSGPLPPTTISCIRVQWSTATYHNRSSVVHCHLPQSAVLSPVVQLVMVNHRGSTSSSQAHTELRERGMYAHVRDCTIISGTLYSYSYLQSHLQLAVRKYYGNGCFFQVVVHSLLLKDKQIEAYIR